MAEKIIKKEISKETKYPEGVDKKVDGMTARDLEVAVKMLAMNSGQNAVIRAMGFNPLQLPDVGGLVKSRK